MSSQKLILFFYSSTAITLIQIILIVHVRSLQQPPSWLTSSFHRLFLIYSKRDLES